MNLTFQNFWFHFYRTAHSSWFEVIDIPALDLNSSALRINLAYPELCEQLQIEAEPNIDPSTLNNLAFLQRLLNKPELYVTLAGVCLSSEPRRDFADAWLMNDDDLAFSSRTCKTLSLDQRFSCHSDFPPDPYGTGVMLLHAYLVNEHHSVWQRVRLAIDKSVIVDLDLPDGTAEFHKPALKRLWKNVDQYLIPNEEEACVAA